MHDDQYAEEFSEPEFLPRWIQLAAIALGVLVRKVWLYICAPFGALALIVALVSSCVVPR